MSNTFEVKVLNSLNDVMFVANVSYIYVTAFADKVKPHVQSISKVPPGSGNCGDNLEYQRFYSGQAIYYTDFRTLMDNIDI
jgi:hypothetical protein